jgi:hypothetical protein
VIAMPMTVRKNESTIASSLDAPRLRWRLAIEKDVKAFSSDVATGSGQENARRLYRASISTGSAAWALKYERDFF